MEKSIGVEIIGHKSKIYAISLLLFVAAIILFVLINICAIYFSFNPAILAYPASHKTNIGASDIPLEYPWGNKSNLTVFVNLENISFEDRKYYVDTILVAMKWWENDGNHNLTYTFNLTMTNNSSDANIIFKWKNTLYGSRNILGHTYINSTGNIEEIKTCDTFNPPFTQCSISILTNLTHEENLKVVKHELGHALGLEHSFNQNDFMLLFLGFNPNYLLNPSEIMFDKEVYNDVCILIYDIIKLEIMTIGILSILLLLVTYSVKHWKLSILISKYEGRISYLKERLMYFIYSKYYVICIFCIVIFAVIAFLLMQTSFVDIGNNLLAEAVGLIFTIILLIIFIDRKEQFEWKIVKESVYKYLGMELDGIFIDILNSCVTVEPSSDDYVDGDIDSYFEKKSEINLIKLKCKDNIDITEYGKTTLLKGGYGNLFITRKNNLKDIVQLYSKSLDPSIINSLMIIQNALHSIDMDIKIKTKKGMLVQSDEDFIDQIKSKFSEIFNEIYVLNSEYDLKKYFN